jgi:hypothetical protein
MDADLVLGLGAAIAFGIAAFMRTDWPGRLVAGGLCLTALALFIF